MNDNFNLICSTIDAGIMVLDTNLNVYFWNKWLENHTKLKTETVVGNKITDFFHNIKANTLQRKIKTALSLQSPTFYTTTECGYLFAIKLTRLTDTVYNNMQQSITIMPYDIEKQHVVVYIYDETFLSEANYRLKLARDELHQKNQQLHLKNEELKSSYEELKIQKDEFQTIFDITKDGLAILDFNSNFIKVNDAYCEITGLTKDELLQTSCIQLTASDDIQKAKDAIKQVLKEGYVRNLEKHYIVHHKHIYINATLALVPNREHILISIKDITQIKKIEEQSKLISMGQMIDNIAHQWRQPLSVISAIASGVKVREEFGFGQDSYNLLDEMSRIVIQTQYLSKTIDNFKNFIKDNANKTKLSINETINKMASIVISSLQNNHIKLQLNLTDDILIDGYEDELIQAFINIIDNAKDALNTSKLDDDDKVIIIKTSLIDDLLFLEITDSGGGIELHLKDRIFEPYFTTKHQSVGTGIGLSLCRQIISEHHNATIDIRNTEFEYNNKMQRGASLRIVFQH